MEHPNNDLGRLKRLTWITLLCAVLFMIFFDASKHLPTLAQVNVFSEDPFDAVGSFGIQLAGFASLLAILRLYRPRMDKDDLPDSAGSILRCDMVALGAVLVTIGADLLALLCDRFVWMDKPAGPTLAALTIGLFILATVLFTLILHHRNRIPHRNRGFLWTILIWIFSGLILAYYPDKWQSTIIGGIAAALVGMLVLFVATAALTLLAFPIHAVSNQDFIDDLSAVIQKLKTNTKIIRGFAHFLNRLMNSTAIHKFIRWFDPHKRPARIVICTAGIMGLILFLVEAFGEGAPNAQNFALVLSVVIGIEATGVVTGFALFRKYLSIVNTHQ